MNQQEKIIEIIKENTHNNTLTMSAKFIAEQILNSLVSEDEDIPPAYPSSTPLIF